MIFSQCLSALQRTASTRTKLNWKLCTSTVDSMKSYQRAPHPVFARILRLQYFEYFMPQQGSWQGGQGKPKCSMAVPAILPSCFSGLSYCRGFSSNVDVQAAADCNAILLAIRCVWQDVWHDVNALSAFDGCSLFCFSIFSFFFLRREEGAGRGVSGEAGALNAHSWRWNNIKLCLCICNASAGAEQGVGSMPHVLDVCNLPHTIHRKSPFMFPGAIFYENISAKGISAIVL